jgi:hypothetical protein
LYYYGLIIIFDTPALLWWIIALLGAATCIYAGIELIIDVL